MDVRNINIDLRKVIAFVVMIILLLIAFQAYHYNRNSSFKGVYIDIQSSHHQRPLLDKKAVMNMVRSHLGFDPTAASIDDIDFWALETHLNSNPFVKNAQVFVDSKRRFFIKINQRKPIARIKDKDRDYYISSDGTRIPPSKISTLRVPIITGHLTFLDVKEDNQLQYYDRLVKMMDEVYNDEFLSALVEQIYINPMGEVELIPKIGKERIIFGHLEEIDEKLTKLKDFYQFGNKEKGWNKYAYFDLSYKGQVIGGK